MILYNKNNWFFLLVKKNDAYILFKINYLVKLNELMKKLMKISDITENRVKSIELIILHNKNNYSFYL